MWLRSSAAEKNNSKTYCWAAIYNLQYLGGAGGTRTGGAVALLEAARGAPPGPPGGPGGRWEGPGHCCCIP
jgi:hypothetical protein